MDDSAADTVPDEELMLRYRDGDAGAFEQLYARHKGPLYRYFQRLAPPAAVAEELFQDVWTNLIRARETYEVRAKFSTWLFRLAHNRLVDHYRRHAAQPPTVNDDPEEALVEQVADETWREPENELDVRRVARRVGELLLALPPEQRETFLLREEGGLSLEEIASATGVNTETAKSRLRYALAKLRAGLLANDVIGRSSRS